ncbi:MAG: hypothetical protein F6K16_43140, partial [Symploca sp. SIO2B6]|nr:hypothetical protein [Symploca sp. SIO2B6]
MNNTRKKIHNKIIGALKGYRSPLETIQNFSIKTICQHTPWYYRFISLGLVGILLSLAVAWGSDRPVLAQLPLSSPRITNYYCHIVDTASEEKTTLRQAALAGDATAQQQYNDILQNHADALHRCRTQNWPKNQAIWVRLYPCDVQVGRLEQLLDEFVDLGYNHVYLETFYNGQVLLPQAENDTPWPSVVRQPGYEHRDLLAEAIAKGHERGLQVYAWMFTMNFGRSYANHSDRQQSLAQNGYGQTSISLYETASLDPNLTFTPPDEAFIDPYNRQAKLDFYAMSQKVLARQPDGILFDYIRYPVGLGADLVANDVEDLWIYGESSQQALLDRALNPSGRQLIQHFLEKGHITEDDVSTITEEPLWQGRQVDSQAEEFSLEQQRSTLQADLWKLAVSHAVQGVLDFLNVAELCIHQWLEERRRLSPVSCLGEFLEEILLEQIKKPIVIFVDEID